MTAHDLYLESGPKRRKTMVHVLDLLGCVAAGPTTDEALGATPDAIRAYRRFLRRAGEPVDPDGPVEMRVVEHITEGDWLGNGSPYIVFAPDLVPLGDDEIDTFLRRLHRLTGELAGWAATRTDEELDAAPSGGGRTARAILLHVLGAQGSYLAPALGGAPGFGPITGAAERGELPIPDAFRRSTDLIDERLRATAPEQRAAVRDLPAGPRTLRKAVRRMLEHGWEHLAELSRRPGGPSI